MKTSFMVSLTKILCLVILTLSFSVPALQAQAAGAAASGTDPTETEGGDLNTPAGLYAAGQYTEAARLYLETSGRQKVPSYYNAARCYHQDYVENSNIESLAAAVDGYFRVLDLDPAHPQALRNLELARRELEQYESDNQKNESPDSQSDQKESQNKDQSEGADNKMSSDDLNNLAEEQEKLADSAGKEQNRQDQSELTEKTEQAASRAGEESPEKDTLDRAVEKQKEALEKMDQGDSGAAAQAQKEAASLLREAARQAEQLESETEDEGDPLPEDIQSVLNREQARNRDRQNTEDVIRVERDW
ncbi:MAG: hypothetical protein PQJ58_07720 [Spirochaetales bacterium]|nr:hypothetical protein [Spirochaetales bacterium]